MGLEVRGGFVEAFIIRLVVKVQLVGTLIRENVSSLGELNDSKNKVNENGVLHHLHRLHGKRLIELVSPLIEPHEHHLVEPVRRCHCYEADRIQNW